MLNEPCSEDKKQKYLGSAQRNVKRSIQLVLDFLDIEKLESNAFAFTATNFPLASLWRSLEDAVLGIAHKRQISLILPEGDEWIFADQDSILRVLINLVSNAIEHGQPKTAVRIRTVNLQTHWEISVEDEGPGIEQKDMQFLFDRFYRTNQKAGGTGLGLTICKHLIEQQGGKIYVRSKMDNSPGTAFSFTVPAGVRGEPRPGAVNP
jgi:signal transduction histidine kinase